MPGPGHRFAAIAVVLGAGCAGSPSPDRAPAHAPDLVVPPMPAASLAPAASAAPAPETAGMSYEEALAQIAADERVGEGKALSDAELTGPLRDASFVAECGAPDSMKVTLKVVVRRGRAIGVSVRTTPPDDAVVRCVDAHARALRWPSSPYADSFTTTY